LFTGKGPLALRLDILGGPAALLGLRYEAHTRSMPSFRLVGHAVALAALLTGGCHSRAALGAGGDASDAGKSAASGGNGGAPLDARDSAASNGGGGSSGGVGGSSNANVPRDPNPVDADVSDGRTPVAFIRETPSTNFPGADVTVYSDASAHRISTPQRESSINEADGGVRDYAAGAPAVVSFLADLEAVGDVSQIPAGKCPKSASFGTVTTVTANGHTSRDLQCLMNPTPAQQALLTDCNQLLWNSP
jgi:hypothetical protein